MAQSEFPQKFLNKLDPEFLDSIPGMDTEEMKQRILDCEQNMYEIDKAKLADTELADIKAKSKEISAPYRESRAKEIAKIQFILYTLESRGIDL